MTKKGYQKRLPTVPPPAVPATRTSPEAVAPVSAPEAVAPVSAPEAVAPISSPESVDPAPPVVTPARRRMSTMAKVAPTILVGLVLVGLVVSLVVGAPEERPAERGPGGGADTSSAPKMLAGEDSYVETQVLVNGDVVVHQWIRAVEPLRQISLALPDVRGAGDMIAVGVQVVADEAVVDGPSTITGRQATYTFDDTTKVEVRYRLTGAVERSESVAGRALALTTTLDVRYVPQPERETRVVRAPEVLSLACSTSAEASPVPCGDAEGRHQWRVDLTGPRVVDRVIAALNLS